MARKVMADKTTLIASAMDDIEAMIGTLTFLKQRMVSAGFSEPTAEAAALVLFERSI